MDDPNSPLFEPLSDREREILMLLADGLSNAEIAQRLHLSPKTIKWYNTKLYEKLDVVNRSQAVERARELGLVRGSDPVSRTPIDLPHLDQGTYFTRSLDGTEIAYATMGEGFPLVRAAHYMTHLEHDLRSPIWAHWLAELSKQNFLVRFDERGCGMSQRDVESQSLEVWVQDLEAVVDDLELEKFALMGNSQGGAVAIAYAALHPERVSHLVLYGAFLGGWIKRASKEDLKVWELERALLKDGWGHTNRAFQQFFVALHVPDAPPEIHDAFIEMMRVSASAKDALRIYEVFVTMDAHDYAPQVEAPTLVLHSLEDPAVTFAEGREVAAAIPNARFVTLEGRNHVLLPADAAWPTFLKEVRQFLAE